MQCLALAIQFGAGLTHRTQLVLQHLGGGGDNSIQHTHSTHPH